MPNTIFSKDLKEIKNFYKINKKIVIKPIHGYGGNNIHLLQGKFKNNTYYLNKKSFEKSVENLLIMQF